jgi:hypothetical protein
MRAAAVQRARSSVAPPLSTDETSDEAAAAEAHPSNVRAEQVRSIQRHEVEVILRVDGLASDNAHAKA